MYKNPHKKKLTRVEVQAMKKLRGDTTIIIKPADKDAAIVIINRSDYLKEKE